MKKDLVELTDEEAYAIENGDEINGGIYSLTYDRQYEDGLHEELGNILEGIGYYEYLVDRYENAEKNLRTIETLIIGSIGKKPYDDIMDLIDLQRGWLNRDIEELRESYDDLNQYIKKTEHNSNNKKIRNC